MSLFNSWNARRGGHSPSAPTSGSFHFGSPNASTTVVSTSNQSASLNSLKTIQVTPASVSIGRGASRSYQTVQWKADHFKPNATVVAGSQVEVQGECCYFEVRIESVSLNRSPTIGVGIATPGYNAGMVGWKSSVGYHADDGKVFAGDGQGAVSPIHHQAGIGDTMGCMWLASGRIMFTKNGLVLDKGFLSLSPSENYCPTITYETDDFLKFTIIREPGYFMYLSFNVVQPVAVPRQPVPQSVSNPLLVPVIATPPPPVNEKKDKGKDEENENENENDGLTEEAAIELVEKLSLFVQQLPKKREKELKAREKFQQELAEANEKASKIKDPMDRFNLEEAELSMFDMDKLKKLKDKLNAAMLVVQEAIEEKDKCIVCMETRRTIAFLPCKHVCCCTECSNAVKSCPICRADVTDRLVLYIS